MKKYGMGVLVFILALMAGGGVSALPDNTFELEGNAIVNGIGDDWQNTVPLSATSEALVSTFVADGSGNATIFTGGGSKDINDLNQWSWKDQLGGLPDKDNITNSYAAAYTNATGDLTIYFGADRFATAGDAQLGFWFFHSRVQAVGGKFVGPDGTSDAIHTFGDILVLANFSNGGSTVNVQVLKWVGGSNPLQLVTQEDNAKCGTNTDPNVCAITNLAETPSPWTYVPKAGTAGQFPAVSFFEGGINLSAFIVTEVGGCFSSFLAETRSSTSQTATLKDFALGSFNTCDIDIAKTCPSVTYNPDTNLLTYTSQIVVTNKGFGTVFDVTMIDTPSAPATAQTFTLATLAKGASHTFTHTFTLTPGLQTPNPPNNVATVSAAVVPNGQKIIDGGQAVATCPAVSFDASLTVSKTCEASLEVLESKLVVVVNVSGQVCNVPPAPATGKIAEAINGVSLTDTPALSSQPISLGNLAVNECKTYSAKYYPSVLTGGSPLAGQQVFLDTIAVTGTGAITNAAKANTASANCPLCR